MANKKNNKIKSSRPPYSNNKIGKKIAWALAGVTLVGALAGGLTYGIKSGKFDSLLNIGNEFQQESAEQKELKNLREQLNILKDSIKILEDEKATAFKNLEDYKSKISELKNASEEQKQELARLQQAYEEKDALVSSLTSQMIEFQAQIQALEEELNQLKTNSVDKKLTTVTFEKESTFTATGMFVKDNTILIWNASTTYLVDKANKSSTKINGTCYNQDDLIYLVNSGASKISKFKFETSQFKDIELKLNDEAVTFKSIANFTILDNGNFAFRGNTGTSSSTNLAYFYINGELHKTTGGTTSLTKFHQVKDKFFASGSGTYLLGEDYSLTQVCSTSSYSINFYEFKDKLFLSYEYSSSIAYCYLFNDDTKKFDISVSGWNTSNLNHATFIEFNNHLFNSYDLRIFDEEQNKFVSTGGYNNAISTVFVLNNKFFNIYTNVSPSSSCTPKIFNEETKQFISIEADSDINYCNKHLILNNQLYVSTTLSNKTQGLFKFNFETNKFDRIYSSGYNYIYASKLSDEIAIFYGTKTIILNLTNNESVKELDSLLTAYSSLVVEDEKSIYSIYDNTAYRFDKTTYDVKEISNTFGAINNGYTFVIDNKLYYTSDYNLKAIIFDFEEETATEVYGVGGIKFNDLRLGTGSSTYCYSLFDPETGNTKYFSGYNLLKNFNGVDYMVQGSNLIF